MRGSFHTDRTAEGVDLIESEHIGHRAGTGVITDDNHHHQDIAELDGKTRLEMLKGARLIVLIFCLHSHRLFKGQLAIVDRLESRHHDGDFPGAGRWHNHITVALRRFAGAQVFQVPAGVERLCLAQLIQLCDQGLHTGILLSVHRSMTAV